MKNLIILFFLLFIFGCNKTTNNPVAPKNSDVGKISFNIDKVNKPSNVVEVEAILTRDGYDTISGSLNLISDTTAELSISNIPAGNWHLKVNALDDSSVVVYSGETDVTILAEITVQVNLTLYPTGNGYGNIYILVNWGQNPSNKWVDYQNNPILAPSDFSSNSLESVTQAKVIYQDGKYKMWYDMVFGNSYTEVWYLESGDGLTWNNLSGSAVLKPGSNGNWDDLAIQVGAVIYDNGQYKMYYTGWNDPYGQWNIGLATSSDGINWNKYSQPVLSANDSEYQVHVDAVVKNNSQYYMYYTIRDSRYYPIHFGIGLATSSDGIHWNRSYNNPILSNSQSWEGYGIYFPSVIIDNGTFKMVYMSPLKNGFGFAESSDGINWTKSSDNPFFNNNETNNNWAQYGIAYPYFVKFNNSYKIYYSGQTTQNGSFSLGIAEKK